jgi:hypothetical protein
MLLQNIAVWKFTIIQAGNYIFLACDSLDVSSLEHERYALLNIRVTFPLVRCKALICAIHDIKSVHV